MQICNDTPTSNQRTNFYLAFNKPQLPRLAKINDSAITRNDYYRILISVNTRPNRTHLPSKSKLTLNEPGRKDRLWTGPRLRPLEARRGQTSGIPQTTTRRKQAHIHLLRKIFHPNPQGNIKRFQVKNEAFFGNAKSTITRPLATNDTPKSKLASVDYVYEDGWEIGAKLRPLRAGRGQTAMLVSQTDPPEWVVCN